ncbi:MAG: hypothetical protein AAB308_14305 [Nitrospirota bacterium]
MITPRIASIESFRVLAIFAVILWHTSTFVPNLSRFAEGHLPVILAEPVVVTGYLLWWVGIPYFLITAGYFFRKSSLTNEDLIAQFRRYVSPLGWLLFGWLCIYIVVPSNWPAEVLNHGWWQPFYTATQKNVYLLADKHISLFLDGGRPVWHLWFLPALMVSLAVLTLVAICQLQKYLIYLIVSLYVMALAEEFVGGHFVSSTIHLGHWIQAILLTALGWWFAEREQPSMAMAWGLIVGGYSTPLPFLARFTLGVYVSHILVMYTLRPILWPKLGSWPLREVLGALVVYAVSVLVTLGVGKVPMARYLVMKPVRKQPRAVIGGAN